MNRTIFAAASVLAVTQAITLEDDSVVSTNGDETVTMPQDNPWVVAKDWIALDKAVKEHYDNLPAHCNWPNEQWNEMSEFERWSFEVGQITCHFGIDVLYGREQHDMALHALKNFLFFCNNRRPETEQIIGAKDDVIAPIAHEVVALVGADHFFTWASVGMAGGMCAEASNYPEDQHFSEVVWPNGTTSTTEGWNEEIQKVWESLPEFCSGWPFNEENPWNFANMLPFEAQQWEHCRLPLYRAQGKSDWETAVEAADHFLSQCKYMAPAAEEIDEHVEMIHHIAYNVAQLGGMSDAAATLSQDIAFQRCKRQAGHTHEAIATAPIVETTGETAPCNCEADTAPVVTTSGETAPIETTA